jgi:DNA-binding SARP family transcriptional activator
LTSESATRRDRPRDRGRAKAILKLLGIAPGHRLHREQIVDLVWPDLPPEHAIDQLYKTTQGEAA